MRNKKTKVLCSAIAISITAAMLAGCGGNTGETKEGTKAETKQETKAADTDEGTKAADTKAEESKDAKKEGGITLTLYGNAGDTQRPFMQNIFKLYEEKTGNKIDVQGIDTDNFENVALTKFQTGDIPDLFMHFGGYGLDAYNPKENFVDFTDAKWVSDIQDNVLPQTKRDDVVYGLPFWEASLSGTFYNKKIFEEQGIEVPKTQEEFNQVCQKLMDAGITPMYMAVKDVWPMLYQFGMDPIFQNEDNLKKINSNQIKYADIPEMTDLANWYKTSADKGYFGKSYNTDTWDYASEVLGNGEAAMMLGWDTWLYTDYDSESYTYKADDFGIMPAFVGTTKEGTFEGPNCSLMLANKNGKNVDAAIDFINFMADPENYNVAFDGISTAPCFKGQTTIQTTPQYDAAVDWVAEVGRPSIANPEIIGFSQNDGGKCIQELLVGNVDAAGCLKMMDDARIKVATAQQVEGFK